MRTIEMVLGRLIVPDSAIVGLGSYSSYPKIWSCIAILRIIHTTPKPGTMPPLNSGWRGQHHGLASCFLSARPVRTSLALHPLAPHLAQAPGGGSSHAN